MSASQRLRLHLWLLHCAARNSSITQGLGRGQVRCSRYCAPAGVLLAVLSVELQLQLAGAAQLSLQPQDAMRVEDCV